MQDFKEIGFNQATVTTFGCIVMTLLGGYGQVCQIRRIWEGKSAEKVSGLMSVIMLTLFASYLVRGIAEERLMFLVQGVVRAGLFVPILVGVMIYGKFTKVIWSVLVVGVVALAIMSLRAPLRISIFEAILYVGLVGAAHQAWSVRKTNGQVSFAFYFTMLGSVSFQAWYGLYYGDLALLVPCVGFMLLYSAILLLMARNKKNNDIVTSA